MTTLITGMGLLAPYVAEALADEWGERPVLFGPVRDASHLDDVRDRATIVDGDILNLPELMAAARKYGVDAIIHTAALQNDDCEEHPYAAVQTNVIGTVNVVEAARSVGARRVVNTSTISVHPRTADHGDGIVRETDPVGLPSTRFPTRGMHLATKIAAEEIGRIYGGAQRVDVITVRLTALYGPTVRRHPGTAGVVQKAVEEALRGEPVVIRRRWTGAHPIIYVKDAARMLALAAKAESLEWNAFVLSAPEAYSFDDLAKILAEETGVTCSVEGDPGLAHPGRLADLTRARAIGYEPRFDLRAGIRDYLDWARKRLPSLPAVAPSNPAIP